LLLNRANVKTRLLRLCWICRIRIIALVLLLLTALKAFAEPVEPPPEPSVTAVVLDHAELTGAIDDDDAPCFELIRREAPRATEHPEQESR
jgi:hypothetical protein